MSGSRGRGGGGGPKGPQRPPQVGKRPSNPLFLLAVALAWFVAGAMAYFGLNRSWKLIPVICFVGVGLLYLRGAAGSYLRRNPPPEGRPPGKR